MTDQAGEDRMDSATSNESGADASSTSAQRDAGGDENDQIRARAYERWLARGGEGGDEREDWFEAEREYRERGHARQAHETRQAGDSPREQGGTRAESDTRRQQSEPRDNPRKR